MLANAEVLMLAPFNPVGLVLFALMLIPSTILSVKLQPGVNRNAYLYFCAMVALLAVIGVSATLTLPRTHSGLAIEVFIMGLFGLPLALGWLAGWPAGKFITLGLGDPGKATS